MKHSVVALALVLGTAVVVAGQGGEARDARLQGQLKRLFPNASGFGPKEGDPRHIKAFVNSERGPQLAGFVFYTTELEPLERGYDGPIKMLVGMDTKGIITGMVLLEHHEPYGNFSVERPEFAAQLKGKSIREPFKVGDDIDAVSRATITMVSASRAIRNSARRVARQLLTPEAVK